MPVKRRTAKTRRAERPVAKRGQYDFDCTGGPGGVLLDENLAERAGFYVLIAQPDLHELIKIEVDWAVG
jgi:hypothetical protein